MLEADVMSAKRFALFDPNSPLNRLRACARASDKLRGYFHWLASRKVSEQEAASVSPTRQRGEVGQPGNISAPSALALPPRPAYRVFRAGAPERPLAAEVAVTFVADKGGERRLTIQVRLKHSSDFPSGEVACRVYLLEAMILERLARRAQTHRLEHGTAVALSPRPGVSSVAQHRGAVHALVVLSDRCIASCGEDGEVRIWDPVTGRTQAGAHHTGRVRALAVTPDKKLVSGGEDGLVQLWDSATRTAKTIARHRGWVGALAVLPDQGIASGGEDGIVQRWDAHFDTVSTVSEEGSWVESLCPVGRPYGSAGRSAGAQRDPRLAALMFVPLAAAAAARCDVAIGCWDGSVRMAPGSGGEVQSVTRHPQAVSKLRSLPDGRVVSAGDDGAVLLTNPSNAVTETIIQHSGAVLDLQVLPNGGVVSAGEDGRVQLWGPMTGPVTDIMQHPGEATTVALLPDGRIASGGSAGTIRVCGPQGGVVRQVAQLESRISALAALPDGCIASGDKNGVVQVTDPAAVPPNIVAHVEAVLAVTVLPDGRIASADRRGAVKVWGPEDDSLLEIAAEGEQVVALAALSDGRLLIGYAEGTLIFHDLTTHAGCTALARSAPLLCLAVCPDDTVVFAESAAATSRICLWRPATVGTGSVSRSLEVSREVRSVAGLSDGRILYSDAANMVHLWDPQTGAVQTIAWQQEGRIAARLEGGQVLWANGESLSIWAPLGGEQQPVDVPGNWTALAVLADGRLAIGDRDGTVRIDRLPALDACGPQAAVLPAIFRDELLAADREAVRILSAVPEVEGTIDGRGHAHFGKALVPGGEPAVTLADLCERVVFAIVLDQ
jgi:WD40 repeat protein